MANKIDGTFTLKEVMLFTNQYVPNRFDFMDRDVVKRILVKEVRQLNTTRPGEPTVKYVIESKSYPQYAPYYTEKDSRGRRRKYQRKISHKYDLTLEMVRLSLNISCWKARVGSGRKWDKKPPQSMVKSIYPENKRRWSKTKIIAHKKRAKYLNPGDYNAQVLGINADFIFRCSFPWWYHGHLFGRNYFGNIPAHVTNPFNIMFFPKHFINMVEVLMNRGILKDD